LSFSEHPDELWDPPSPMRTRDSECMGFTHTLLIQLQAWTLRKHNSHIKLRPASNEITSMANSLLEFKAMKHIEMRVTQKVL
jgi:hypothetical protein